MGKSSLAYTGLEGCSQARIRERHINFDVQLNFFSVVRGQHKLYRQFLLPRCPDKNVISQAEFTSEPRLITPDSRIETPILEVIRMGVWYLSNES